jgi:DNA primase
LGLVKTGEYGDYDFFRDRLMFPIHNTISFKPRVNWLAAFVVFNSEPKFIGNGFNCPSGFREEAF